MKYKYIVILLLLLFIKMIGCKNPTDLDDGNTPPIIPSPPPTEIKGPGGPAYLSGNIKDYINPIQTVTNTHIYVMNQQDYTDTIAHIFITSTNASFRITDLPEGRVDLIFMNEKYLCAKIGKLLLRQTVNSFYNPYSSGYFIDSTIYITNIADSVGRPDAPKYGLQGYGPGLGVYFKLETPDSVAWMIVQLSGCDTLYVHHYDDPVFDPYENDIYQLKCIDTKTIKNKLFYFNWLKEVKSASPVFQVIQP